MNELLTKYERFFKLLRRDQEKKYEDYAKTALNQLFAECKAYYGYIIGITNRGEMVLKFENGYAPRLKVPMEFCVLRKRAFAILGDNIAQWSWNSLKFRENADLHTSFSSVLPIFYLDDRRSAGCGQIDYEMVRQLKPHIENKEKLQFVMLETMPPTEMLMHLANYINSHSTDKNLMLQPFRSYDDWKPKELKNTDNVSQQVIDILEKDKICVLQGPPGTGKSYTLGEIISNITEKGESVCVTTQSNDSLTSLVAQETLEPLINRKGHISKTVLTSEEKKKYPFLSAADRNLLIPKGGLLLSTYYSLSRIISVH